MSLMIKSWLAILFWAQISIGTSAIPRIRAVENRKQCYRTQALVGWGRHGTVHRAVPSTQPGTIVAVKKVKLPTGSSSKPEVDFLQAFSQTSSYCGVPRLFDLIRSGNSLYMVEQYFEGKPLHYIGDSFERANIEDWENRVMRLLYKVTTIVNLIHEAKYVHGDVKPGNILYDDHDNVMVVDFGSCRKIYPWSMTRLENLPEQREIADTCCFVPPEKHRGLIGYSSDIYSLGKTARWLPGLLRRLHRRVTGSSVFDEVPRLREFIGLTVKESHSERPTAEDLLRHPVFNKERLEYGISAASDQLPPFELSWPSWRSGLQNISPTGVRASSKSAVDGEFWGGW
ncbi:unnamed protein product (mitochondrion) [Plasmodiophora brassicae]|uniref:Protein kinase domain-containing protein n=1 Tax=Plasmodiophora brassicae TaxID=37360 RepID=A0A3P3Y2Y3_PLABS|nr:unnamed protein product [Plasmodiophora brassicae]